jgi:hypothetical protein
VLFCFIFSLVIEIFLFDLLFQSLASLWIRSEQNFLWVKLTDRMLESISSSLTINGAAFEKLRSTGNYIYYCIISGIQQCRTICSKPNSRPQFHWQVKIDANFVISLKNRSRHTQVLKKE